MMREKGIITQAEYESALRDARETSGTRAPEGTSLVVGKFSTTIYGFVDGDFIYDSTQSFLDLAASNLVQRPGTYKGEHPETQFSIRNTRLDLRFRAPEFHEIQSSALIEMDFLGQALSPSYAGTVNVPAATATTGVVSGVTENQFFTSPIPRIRHAYVKVESPIVDALFGQTWHLFGWGSTYQPNTVVFQGVPGELYSRTPQLRLSKTLKTDDITFDVAAAALRPPESGSALPEAEGGLHFAVNKWTGGQTIGQTGNTISPASIAVTGDVRTWLLPLYEAAPKSAVQKSSAGIAVDAFIPVIPGSKDHLGNTLSLLGEFVTGSGIADQYTSLSGGVGNAAFPAPALAAAGAATPSQYYLPIDPGMVYYDKTGNVHFIDWTTVRVGLQYFLPGLDGKMWIAANFANVSSDNSAQFGLSTAKTLKYMDWFDVLVMGDLTPAVRLGLEYGNYSQTYNDETLAVDHRVQGSAYFIF